MADDAEYQQLQSILVHSSVVSGWWSRTKVLKRLELWALTMSPRGTEHFFGKDGRTPQRTSFSLAKEGLHSSDTGSHQPSSVELSAAVVELLVLFS